MNRAHLVGWLFLATACYRGDFYDDLVASGTGTTSGTTSDGSTTSESTTGADACSDEGLTRCEQGLPQICQGGGWADIEASEVGCEFRAIATPQPDGQMGSLGIAIINPGLASASVTVEGAATDSVDVGPGMARQLNVDFLGPFANPGGTTAESNAAYRISSTLPVSVWQLSPASAADSNDGSLLLPRHVWDDTYHVASYNHWVGDTTEYVGFYAAAAGSDGTTITPSPSPSGGSVTMGSGIDADGTGAVSLDDGGALLVVSARESMAADGGVCGWNDAVGKKLYQCAFEGTDPSNNVAIDCPDSLTEGDACGTVTSAGCCDTNGDNWFCQNGSLVMDECGPLKFDGSDLTGTRIAGSQPFTAVAGHQCTNIPWYVASCDHLEDTLLPSAAVTNEYVAAAPATTGGMAADHVIRIVATEADTQLSYNPPVPNAPESIAGAGQVVEVRPGATSVQITASKAVVVSQLGTRGELEPVPPALVVTPPVTAGKTSYRFFTPAGFESFALIVTGPDATVSLDGAEVAGGTAVGTSPYEVRAAAIVQSADGQHTVESDQAVVVTVFGTTSSSAYWYPAGVAL